MALGACVRDEVRIKAPDNDMEVTFSINLPSSARSRTRALEEEDENEIKNIQLLIFENGLLKAAPSYAYVIRDASEEGGDVSKKSFRIRLPKGRFDIMVFANSLESFEALETQFENLVGSASKEDVLSQLVIDMPSSDGRWPTDPSNSDGNYLIPMWGEKRDVLIEDGTKIENLYLHRMLARVDISVVDAPEKTGDFKIKKLRLYNGRSKGRIAPKEENWNPNYPNENLQNDSHGQAINASPVGERVGGVDYTHTLNGNSSKQEIYLFEAPQTDETAIAEAPCLILEAEYKGTPSWYRIDFATKSNLPSGYKYHDLKRNFLYNVNILEVNGPGYETEDDAINRRGDNIVVDVTVWDEYDLGDIIFNGQYFLAVNPGESLIDKTAKKDNEIVIKTDDKSGELTYVVSSSDEDKEAGVPSWFTNYKLVQNNLSGRKNLKEYIFSYDVSENSDGLERSVYIYFTSGRLTNIVRVTQGVDVDVSLKFQKLVGDKWEDVSVIYFPQESIDDAPQEESYRLTWAPAKANVKVSATGEVEGENRLISWSLKPEVTDNESLSSDSGSALFTVQPNKLDDYTKGSFIGANDRITASIDYEGKGVITSLNFRQFVKDILIESGVELMDGKEEHFVNIKSNVPWALYMNENNSSGIGEKDVKVVEALNYINLSQMEKSDNNKQFPILKGGSYNLPEGTSVRMKTVNDIDNVTPKIFTGNLSLYAESRENEELNDSKDIMCVSGILMDGRESNSYVLDPTSGAGVLIPVRAANGVFKQDGVRSGKGNLYWPTHQSGAKVALAGTITEGMEYGAKLVWSDNYGTNEEGKKVGIAKDGLISVVAAAGKGPDGHVLVVPGEKAKSEGGNAVVAVTDENGKILWSWHIWVTDGMKYSEEGIMQGILMAGENGAKQSDYWLDRNLGALDNGVSEVTRSTFGLQYQWGRKDAFPGLYHRGTTANKPIYDENGQISGGLIYTSGGNISVATSIANPLRFHSGGGQWTSYTPRLWGVNESTGTQQYQNGGEIGKSIFDPCPAGYRVPVRKIENWNNSEKTYGNQTAKITSDFVNVTNATKVLAKNYKGSIFPYSGVRKSDGALVHSSSTRSGFYWHASQFWTSITAEQGQSASMTVGIVYPTSLLDTDYGCSVRCVAE